MGLSGIGQLSVDLIGQDIEIVPDDDVHQLFQILSFHDRAGRVIGERQDQNLGPGSDRCLEFLRCQPELILVFQIDNDGRGIRQHSAGLIGDIGGLRDQHLIAGIDHGAEHQVDSLGSSDCDEDFLVPDIIDVLGALHVPADFLAQFPQTGIGRVKSTSLLQRVDTLIPDVPGSVKIRLTDAERDGVLHLTDKVEKFPDPGRLEADRFFR